MDFNLIFSYGIDILRKVYDIAIIVIPLMVVMEILKDFKVLDKLAKMMSPVAKLLGISEKSTFPLIIGLTLGLSYGAGAIIQSSKEGDLSKKDLYLLIIFLVACHSVFEDTLLFVSIGANGWLLLTIRIVTAFVLTSLVARKIDLLLDNKKGSE